MDAASDPKIFRLQFGHPEKTVRYRDEVLDDDLLAAIHGVVPEEYRDFQDRFREATRTAAANLMVDPEFSAAFTRLPIREHQTIVGFGDSLTDDRQSWIEILRSCFEQAGRAVEIVNAGISGQTTSQLLVRIPNIALTNPDWILCLVGTNDVRRHGPPETKPLVTITETEQNLLAMRQVAASYCDAQWVWITPPPINEEATRSFPMYVDFNLNIRDEDVAAIASVMHKMPEITINMRDAFGVPATEGLIMGDGIHATLEGQMTILKSVVLGLVDNTASAGAGAG